MKEFLSQNGITYIDRDIENQPGALEELRALGFQTLPVTVIAGKAIPGFNPKQLTEVLHLGARTTGRTPAETIPYLGRALAAVERAVRQMPDDKLKYSIPGRARPMNELTYHIFNRIKSDIEEFTTGIAPPRSPEAGRAYTSFRDIADYGRTVIEQYRSWASKQNGKTRRRVSPAEPDASRRAERLDNLAAHTTQHLRQLYFLLESFGITPENRLADSEMPSEYVLNILW